MRKYAVIAMLATAAVAASPSGAREKKLGEAEGAFARSRLGGVLTVSLNDTLAPQEREYLGLGAPGPFTLGAVRAEPVVAEFFNSSCYACVMLAPVMGEVWRKVDARADLRGRVRFVGIGVGNTFEQAREFHERYDTPFPMLADPEFATFDALGTFEGTPYLMLLRRGADQTVTARAQVGYIPQADVVVAAVEARWRTDGRCRLHGDHEFRACLRYADAAAGDLGRDGEVRSGKTLIEIYL